MIFAPPTVQITVVRRMKIIPDLTLSLLMTLPFLVTFIGMHFLLFKPFLAYLNARKMAVTSATAEATDLKGQITSKMTEIEHKLADARGQVAAARAEARATALVEEAAILAAARAESEKKTAAALQEIKTASLAAAAGLQEAAKSLSADISGAILEAPTN